MNWSLDRRIYSRFIIPYAVILLICSLVGLVSYLYSFKIVEKEIIQSNIAMLRQTQMVIDHRFEEVGNMAIQLGNNRYVQRLQLLEDPHSQENVYRVIEAMNEIYNYNLSNSFIDGYYIIYDKSDLVLSHGQAYMLDYFLENIYFYKNIPQEKWRKLFVSTFRYDECFGTEPVTVESGIGKSVFTYVHSLGNFKYHYGSVIVLIDHAKIEELFSPIDLSQGGAVVITGPDNRIVHISSKEPELYESFSPAEKNSTAAGAYEYEDDGKTMLVSHSLSDVNGWNYYAIQPKSLVVQQVSQIRVMIFLIIIGVFLFGMLGVTFYSIRNNYAPVKRIINALENSMPEAYDSHEDPFDFISQNVDYLIEHEEVFQNSLKEQEAQMRVILLENLCHGNLGNTIEPIQIAATLNLNREDSVYAVAIVQFHFTAHTAENMVLAKTVLTEYFGPKAILHTQSNQQLVVLFQLQQREDPANEDSEEEALKSLKGIYGLLSKEKIFIGLGCFYEDIMDISESYEEALNALEIGRKKESGQPVLFRQLEWHDGFFRYNEKTERKLMSLVRSGKEEEAEALLEDLYQTNIYERDITIKMQKLFLYELLHTASKLQKSGETGKQGELLDAIENFQDRDVIELYREVSAILLDICSIYGSTKRSHNDRLVMRIKGFIEENYHDVNLSLTMIAGEFNISEVYLSIFFKEQTGQLFSNYLETLRIEKACELLVSTGLGIKDIAAATGYASSNTFCRAFKRSRDLSATQYRAFRMNQSTTAQ